MPSAHLCLAVEALLEHSRRRQHSFIMEIRSHQLGADRKPLAPAGNPARLIEQTNTSARYIATGSSVFSPALNAGVGVVGVNSRSTPESKTCWKSLAISARTR
jgi:hypothetical protein